MFTFLTILIVITCVLLVLVVLAQNAKGGGLAAGFTGGTQMMGVKKTTDFIEKLTWGLAIALVIFCLAASLALSNHGTKDNSSALSEQAENSRTNRQQPGGAPIGQPGQPVQQAPAPAKGK